MPQRSSGFLFQELKGGEYKDSMMFVERVCLSSMFACLFKGLSAVYLVTLLKSISNATYPLLSHKDSTQKVSFFLVYIILITRLDLDLAKKSSDVVFQKDPLV